MKWWPDKYPSNCRQQHVGWVGYNHNDWPDDERCPVCRAMDEADALRASLAAAEERLAKRDADHAECALSLADCAIERDKLTAALADERARYEALVGAVDPGPCPCCGDNIHAGHSLDCTFADDCPEEARAWDRVHEAIAANAVPAASLSAHDAEVLERAIKAIAAPEGECEGLMAGEAKYGDPYTPGFNDGLRSARDSVRALAAQEVKP